MRAAESRVIAFQHVPVVRVHKRCGAYTMSSFLSSYLRHSETPLATGSERTVREARPRHRTAAAARRSDSPHRPCAGAGRASQRRRGSGVTLRGTASSLALSAWMNSEVQSVETRVLRRTRSAAAASFLAQRPAASIRQASGRAPGIAPLRQQRRGAPDCQEDRYSSSHRS